MKDQKNMINKKLLEKNDNEEKRNEMLKKFIGDKKTKIEVQKSDSSFIFTMNHIEFNLPMDPMKDNTPILAFNFNLSYIQKFLLLSFLVLFPEAAGIFFLYRRTYCYTNLSCIEFSF